MSVVGSRWAASWQGTLACVAAGCAHLARAQAVLGHEGAVVGHASSEGTPPPPDTVRDARRDPRLPVRRLVGSGVVVAMRMASASLVAVTMRAMVLVSVTM